MHPIICQHEDRICLDLGLNYIQVPISWDTPSDDQCLLVLDMIDHLIQGQTVWLHCAKNFRVSSLMYLYRQYYMDVDMPTAQDLMHQIWEPNETWTGLIHAVALQLQGRKATQEFTTCTDPSRSFCVRNQYCCRRKNTFLTTSKP